ncbi:MAG: stress-induced protein [Polyangia bacterium]
MSAERRRQIASIGGKIAHERGRAHVFTAEEAQLAGRKGGRVVSQDAEHMARIGSRGGATRWSRVKKVGQPASEAAAPAAVREGA